MNRTKIVIFCYLLIGCFNSTALAHIYTLFSDGMPNDAVVNIGGQEFRGLNAQGDQCIEIDSLKSEDVKVRVGGGYQAQVIVDAENHQVMIKFVQFFVPTSSVNAEKNFPYLLKMPMAYVRRDGNNLVHTTNRSDADRFIFVEKTQGQYLLYDLTAKVYVYYTSATNGQIVKNTNDSHVKYTTKKSIATTWQLLMLSDEAVAIVPGSIDAPNMHAASLNFTGGIAGGSVLNLWSADDANSAWQIVDPTTGSIPCSTLLYSLPGAQFIHKIVTNEGDSVESVDFAQASGGADAIRTLHLMTDRENRGNKYKYIAGNAPTKEGEYTYTVNIKSRNGDMSQVKVRLIVSNHLQSPTPMMAWLTWNWFARAISHDKMVAIAEGMQRHGLVEAGFNTIVLDDAWASPTQDKAALTYDPKKFPIGIIGLKDALKAINPAIKIGIYSDAGSMTCENYQPGSYQYETQHIALFDSWGVDMLKYDYCNSQASTKVSYTRMGDVINRLNETRKSNGQQPFVYNICEWGKTEPWLWGSEAGGSSWRSTSDAREDWLGNSSRPGVLAGVDETRRLWMYAGVNRFNDLDMMCIGLHGLGGPSNNTRNHMSNGGKITGLTDAQARSQMSLWCMLASPLSLTCDLRQHPKGEANAGIDIPNPLITPADIETLTNREILSINQDALGQQAEYMEDLSTGNLDYSDSGYDVYVKDLTDGRFAVSVTNRSGKLIDGPVLPLADMYMESGTTYLCREVWTKVETEVTDSIATGTIQPYETLVYILKPKKRSYYHNRSVY